MVSFPGLFCEFAFEEWPSEYTLTSAEPPQTIASEERPVKVVIPLGAGVDEDKDFLLWTHEDKPMKSPASVVYSFAIQSAFGFRLPN